MSNAILKLDLIQKFIEDNNLSKKEFCKRCDMSVYMLNKILKGFLDFDFKILFRIARTLGVEAVDIINKNFVYHKN